MSKKDKCDLSRSCCISVDAMVAKFRSYGGGGMQILLILILLFCLVWSFNVPENMF